MNSDRRAILSLIQSGHITPMQAERLIAVANESRETAWIVVLCVALACLAQLHLHEFANWLMHFLNTQLPIWAETLHRALSPITDLITLTTWGGLL